MIFSPKTTLLFNESKLITDLTIFGHYEISTNCPTIISHFITSYKPLHRTVNPRTEDTGEQFHFPLKPVLALHR